MKMKEICRKTNLTERTIRYYVERGLIQPIVSVSGTRGRTDYQFDNTHISLLRNISTLRKFEFSIDQILEIQRSPSVICHLAKEQAQKIEAQEQTLQRKKEVFSRISFHSINDMAQLAEALRKEEQTLSLPNTEMRMDFRRLDEMEGFEPDGKDSADLEKIFNREVRKRKWLLTGIGFVLLLTLGFGFWAYRARRVVTTIFFTTLSSATFTEKWQENGQLFAMLRFGEGSDLAGTSCTVRFDNYPLYWAIVPEYEYIAATITAEVPLREGRKKNIIIEDTIPSVDMSRLLQDEELCKKYAVVATVQGQ